MTAPVSEVDVAQWEGFCEALAESHGKPRERAVLFLIQRSIIATEFAKELYAEPDADTIAWAHGSVIERVLKRWSDEAHNAFWKM